MPAVDHEPADQRKCLCVDVLDQDNVDPACGSAANVCDEETLIVARQDSRKPIGSVFLGQVVTQLLRQSRHVCSIRLTGHTNRDRTHSHGSDM